MNARFWSLWIVSIGLVVLLTYVLVGAEARPQHDPVPAVIRAQKFELVDEKGKVYASLSREKGMTIFNMKTKDENAGFTTAVDDRGAAILTLSSTKKTDRHHTILTVAPDASKIDIIRDGKAVHQLNY